MGKSLLLNWASLLSAKRVRLVPNGNGEDAVCTLDREHDTRSPFERDYSRVAYSSAFRCMARKTQIASAVGLDTIHFRLTHSIEVSIVAGSLWREVSRRLVSNYGISVGSDKEVDWILRTAGLAHDIGNPPLGHAGERAIQEWAKRSLQTVDVSAGLRKDLSVFDGNAESFRLLSRPDGSGVRSLNLTVASLGATIKYPNTSNCATHGHPKFCAFHCDEHIFEKVMRELGLERLDGTYARHPLSFLLEAADDISYMLSDLEDAIRLGIRSVDEVCNCFKMLLGGFQQRMTIPIQRLRSYVVEVLIAAYADGFCSAYDSIMHGSVISGTDFMSFVSPRVRRWIEDVKKIEKQIFLDKVIVKEESKGCRDLTFTLNKYLSEVRKIAKSQRIDNNAKERVAAILNRPLSFGDVDKSLDWWVHIIIDYVVGMSDSFLKLRNESS